MNSELKSDLILTVLAKQNARAWELANDFAAVCIGIILGCVIVIMI